MLKRKLIPNAIATFVLILFFPAVKEKYSDKAIKKNKMFQTIGKIQPGGVMLGLTESYHSPLVFPLVNKLPINATKKTIIKLKIKIFHLTMSKITKLYI